MRSLFAILLFFASLLSAQAETWTGAADVKFKGYSTLHDFTGTVSAPLKVSVSGEKGARTVSATSDVEVKRMSTKDDARDKNMMLMFNAAKFALLKVNVANTDESALKKGTMPVALTIAGRGGKVAAAVTNISESASAVSFDLAFPVSLTAFKLDPPKAIGGLVKVKDTVDVTAHVTLTKQ
jgi:hypothetical protein